MRQRAIEGRKGVGKEISEANSFFFFVKIGVGANG